MSQFPNMKYRKTENTKICIQNLNLKKKNVNANQDQNFVFIFKLSSKNIYVETLFFVFYPNGIIKMLLF